MERLLQDLKYGARILWKSPVFAAVAVITLGLGIGANTAVFSILNALFQVPLLIDDPDRIVIIQGENQPQNLTQAPVSAPDFLDLRKQKQSFDYLVAGRAVSYNFAGKDEPMWLQAFQFSSGFLPLLGAQPAQGRGFQAADEETGAEAVVILSHSFWEQTFGADPSTVGQRILLDGRAHTIVGIANEGFFFPRQNIALWTPLVLNRAETPRDLRNLLVLERLKEGTPLARARSEMATIAGGLEETFPKTNKDWGISIQTLRENVVSGSSLALTILYTAISFVILIACANVAGLLVARAASREKEITLRTALGAGRRRLIRQLLTESLVLALLGGVLGLVLGIWWMQLLKAMLDVDPQLSVLTGGMQLDAGILAHTAGISLVAGILFGLVPALQISKTDLQSAMQQGGRGSGQGTESHRLRSLLVVVQVALALALLTTTTMFVRALGQVWATDPGFEIENLLTLQISLPEASYPEEQDSIHFFQQAVVELSELPGVLVATTASRFPVGLLNSSPTAQVTIEGAVDALPNKAPEIVDVVVSPSYLETLGLKIVRGRNLARSDNQDTLKVALVSEAFVQRYWPKTNPLGKRFKIGQLSQDPAWLTVIGVSEDLEDMNPGLGQPNPTLPHAFLPLAQNATRTTNFMLRTGLDPHQTITGVSSVIQEIDPNQAIANLMTMEQQLQQRRVGTQTVLRILGALSVIALLLAAVGIYGVISYLVSQRRHTIGIRLALGARPADVLWMVLKQGAVLASVGVLLGLVLALGLTQLIKSQLAGLSTTGATDPLTFGGMALLLLSVVLLATYLPARRAMRVDPVDTLRST